MRAQREDAVDITAVNGIPIAGHAGPGSIADITVRRLLALQGLVAARADRQPAELPGRAERVRQAGRHATSASASAAPGAGARARRRRVRLGADAPDEWTRLIARLGEIPDPTVASGPSPAAIPDKPGARARAEGKRMATASPPSPPRLAAPAAAPAAAAGAAARGRCRRALGRVLAVSALGARRADRRLPRVRGRRRRQLPADLRRSRPARAGRPGAGRRRAGGHRHEHRADPRLQGEGHDPRRTPR